MKLLVLTAIKEDKKALTKVMHQAGIQTFSITETVGFKGDDSPNLLDSWFANGSEQVDSIFLFSFTEDLKAEATMTVVREYNENGHSKFPIHAFILPVEKASY